VSAEPLELPLFVSPAYESLGPLARGEVTVPGLAVTVRYNPPETSAFGRDPFPACEMGLSRFVARSARGDCPYVGIPAFIYRGFRHRMIFVRADSPFGSVADLRGATVGVSGWSDTGNTWAKSLFTDAGIEMDEVAWVEGPLDHPEPERPANVAAGAPRHVRWVGAGRTLADELAQGRLDALVGGFAPAAYYQAGTTLRRLHRDLRRAEEEYFRTTSLYPVLHLIGVDRRIAARHPEVLARLQAAVSASRETYVEQARRWGNAAPWSAEAFEEIPRVFGPEWREYGLQSTANRAAIEAFARAQVRQGYVSQALGVNELFGEYLRSESAAG